MSQQRRQSNLYAGEDWSQIYESFYQISLNSYDFDSIRQSMVDYLSTNYPDTFNDWIANDEFLFILDTIAMLGQNLAFRMDMNTRENFMDTATRRASVLKLAKMISYAPRRSYPGRALAKVTEIKTNQDVRNSFNKSLKDKTIRWNDPTDPNWYENFILVMNNVFVSTNQFGNPVKKTNVNGLSTHLYKMNTNQMQSPAIPFSANVNGESMKFEVVNPDINSSGVDERHPEPQEQKYIIYQNDGNGFNSINTGFFVYFKQGTLSKQDFDYSVSIENRLQDINVNNINETDVWVQEINQDGLVRTKWTKVPAMESVAYNSVDRKKQTIFSVTTRDNDQISIKFPDSRSGVVPRGTFRTWYRVSNGMTYSIKTTDIQNKSIKYQYRTNAQSNYEQSILEVKFTLQYESSRAQSAETLEQIKARAPQLYYTQNRFVNGEDYDIAPLSQGNLVQKAKAINRIYSGQSRFIDINDPTGKYQNTDVFSDDGSMYKDKVTYKNTVSLPTSKPNASIVVDSIQPLIGENAVIQKYQSYPSNTVTLELRNIWTPEYNSNYTNNTYGKILDSTGKTLYDYQVGTLILFTDGNTTIWSSITNVLENGYYILSTTVPTSMYIQEYIKPYRISFNSVEIQSISAELDKKTDFVLIYDTSISRWVPVEISTDEEEISYQGITVPVMVNIKYTSESWSFESNGIEYIFVGGSKVRFYFVNPNKINDINSGTVQNDKITILSSNTTDTSNLGLSSDIQFQIIDNIEQDNGYIDGSRVVISSTKIDTNGIPLEPNQFSNIVPDWESTDLKKYGAILIFQQNEDFTVEVLNLPDDDFTLLDSSWKYTNSDALAETNAYKRKEFTRNVEIRSTLLSDLFNKGSGFVIGFAYNDNYYFIEQNVGNNNDRLNNLITNMTSSDDTSAITPETAFYRAIMNNGSSDVDENQKLSYYGYDDVSTQYDVKVGARSGVYFHWKHYAPDDNRIDPSKTNLIDMYVLTTSYHDEVQLWIKNGASGTIPKPPTSVELKQTFSDVELRSVISDSLIWHSARYLPLFGDSADESYRADFKVVPLPNTTMSDDEIRQNVISLCNEYFSIDNWDFGESFYYTDLCTYIQSNLGRYISTIVIVSQNPDSKFGSLFEIPSQSDQIFISTATVDNVQIVKSLAKTNINIGS